jgi:hypothetical protein
MGHRPTTAQVLRLSVCEYYMVHNSTSKKHDEKVVQFGFRLRTLDKATATAPLHSVQAFLRKEQKIMNRETASAKRKNLRKNLIPMMVGRAENSEAETFKG